MRPTSIVVKRSGAPLWEPLCGNPSQALRVSEDSCASPTPPRGGGENVYNDLGVW